MELSLNERIKITLEQFQKFTKARVDKILAFNIRGTKKTLKQAKFKVNRKEFTNYSNEAIGFGFLYAMESLLHDINLDLKKDPCDRFYTCVDQVKAQLHQSINEAQIMMKKYNPDHKVVSFDEIIEITEGTKDGKEHG